MTPLTLTPERFRAIGHQLVDDLARHLAAIPAGPVTHDERPSDVRAALDTDAPLPEQGADAAAVVADATERLFAHALFNAHPRFWGYITSSPAPIGSTLFTSAPSSPRYCAHCGPASTLEKSSTRRPARGAKDAMAV